MIDSAVARTVTIATRTASGFHNSAHGRFEIVMPESGGEPLDLLGVFFARDGAFRAELVVRLATLGSFGGTSGSAPEGGTSDEVGWSARASPLTMDIGRLVSEENVDLSAATLSTRAEGHHTTGSNTHLARRVGECAARVPTAARFTLPRARAF